MANVLVCLDDGLLKNRIIRILTEKSISFTITEKPISRSDLYQYSVVIIHSSYKLNDLYSFIENVVIQKATTILYLTSNIGSNPFRKFINHSNLIFVDEAKMDVELPYALELYQKYSQQIDNLNKENAKLAKKVKESNNLAKCKRKLISEGYSEEEAHKYILKYAMDNHIDKLEACNRLLGLDSE